MPDPRWGPKGHGGWGPKGHGGRPPWWPEDEPFPPAGGEWHRVRARFFRRMLVFGFLVLGLIATIAIVVGSTIAGLAGRADGRGPLAPVIVVVLALAFVGFLATARAVRRMAAPIGDVMEAADRVAGGDYRARVHPRGPREVRRLGESFNEMAERLEANERQRRALLADVAHELRTPLSVIRGNVEGVLDGLYPADGEHLETLLGQTVAMERLLEDLQTLSTAEAGVLRLHRERVHPSDLIAEAAAAYRSAAEAGRVSLHATAADELPELHVDPVRIGEVLRNLLSNALRHTPAGGSVTVSALADADGVRFVVADTGSGIEPDRLPHVFDRFVSSSSSGGAGLGLAIARTLVEAHGGAIEAESEPGHGTTMRFRVPRS